MSSRRSRFKVAASIPVRRKPALFAEVPNNESKSQVEANLAESNKVVESETNNIQVEETVKENEQKSTETLTASSDEKPLFKRIKKPLHLPVRKQKSEGVDISQSLPSQKGNDVTNKNQTDVMITDNVITKESSLIQLTFDNYDASEDEKPGATSVNITSGPSCNKSPARVRFARPAVMDTAIRRHSIYASSASESEDENRRSHSSRNCIPPENCSMLMGRPVEEQISQPPVGLCLDADNSECARLALLPKRKRQKISNFVRKIAEARRDFNDKFAQLKPDRSSVKMFDLIFYNPNNSSTDVHNSAVPLVNERKVPELPQPEKEPREEEVDDPDRISASMDIVEKIEEAVPVPQVKIGGNGEIILDEQSLVIETTETKKGREALMNSTPVYEDPNKKVSYYGKKHTRFKDWSPVETKCFYKALNAMGTDFALMQSLFPSRSRAELKNKFKREERINSLLIDQALSSPTNFNLSALKDDIDRERLLVEEEIKREVEDKMRMERERKEEEALRKAESTTRELGQSSVDTLKRFIGHSVGVKARRSTRGPQRRKLLEDFVDPFEVDEVKLQDNGKENQGLLVESESHLVNRQPSHSTNNRYKNPMHEEKLKSKKQSNKRVKHNENITVYYPDMHDSSSSDNESVASEITDGEFVSILKRNIQNLGETTIRVEAPPLNEASSKPVRVLMDVVDVPSKNNNGATTTVSKVFKVESNRKSYGDQSTCTFYSSLENNVTIAAENPQQVEFVESRELVPSMEQDMETVYTFSPNQNSSPVADINTTENIQELCNNKPIVNKESQGTETIAGASVNYRNTGGIQYALIEAGTNPEQKRTYLAGLKPGSFVFMANESNELPLERRCSMFMISEKVLANGKKELTPMPVILPPPLMQLITNELNL